MRKIIHRICYYTFDIIGLILWAILIWLIASTLEIAFSTKQYQKSSLNLFVIAQDKNKNNDIEIITDDEDHEENEITKC
jgi:hypothetical protein